MLRNPFTNRAMIADPADFFGRRRELDSVLTRVVGGSKAQSLSLVGQRRIGKSSLFRRLGALLPAQDPRILAVYLDLEASRKLSAGKFFAQVLGRLRKAAREPPVDPPGEDAAYDALAAWLEDQEGKRRSILLLDEFDTVTSNPAFDADFFGSLRYLANNFDLAFVTSSYEDLTDLCHAEEVRQSPFFNVFTTLDLSLMPAEEVREMLAALFARSTLDIPEAERGVVHELGGRYPFFLQVAASAVWELRRETGQARSAAVEERFHAEADGHFRYFVEHLPERERSALLRLLDGETPADPLRRRLARRSLILPGAGAPELFSRGFRSWLESAPWVAAAAQTRRVAIAREASLSEATQETPADGVLAVGVVVGLRYELERPLGRGSYGQVYLARDTVLGRHVALKFLQIEGGPQRERERRLRFLKEARVLARMKHPNVVTVFDLGEWGSTPFIAMELVDGGTLAERLAREGRLSPPETARLGREAALGLAHAHALDIVHRDVKPANLMLERDGRLRVADFGVGRTLEQEERPAHRTAEGVLVGTPAYMAPEQLRGEPATAAADVYGLGVVLYECLTGRRPFEGASVASIVARILSEDPEDPRLRRAELPEGMCALVLRAVARDPRERFSSADELARALGDFVV